MKMTQAIVVALALFLGALAGYMFNPATEVKAEAAAEEETAKRKVADKGDAATIAALRARVKELERRLASARSDREAAVDEALAVGAEKVAEERKKASERRHGPRDFRAEMEKLKKENPERFAEMQRRMKEGRARMQARQQGRRAFLADVDTSTMSADERKTHANYQSLLDRQEALREKMSPDSDADLTDEERQALFDEARQLHREIRSAEAAERALLLKQTTEALGLSGDDAAAMIDTVNQVYESTGAHLGAHGGGSSGGEPPPGPPPAP